MRSVTIVGASLAGLSAARALRTLSYDGRIVVVGDERHEPYDRPPLSKDFLAGKDTDLELSTEDDAALDLDWRLGTTAVRLHPARRAVELDSGAELVSDGVVLATGARARTLGAPLAGVHTLRSLDDALALRADLAAGGPVVVVGAGFIGAEVASTARKLGLDVTVVEALPAPLAEPLGEEMGAHVAALHTDHGTRLITGVGVEGFVTEGQSTAGTADEGWGMAGPEGGSRGIARLAGGGWGGASRRSSVAGGERVRAVRLADGRELPASTVVVGIGATPNVEWLAGSGLELGPGVRTDARCATSIPGVVATGDCASAYNPFAGATVRLEHWTNALQQPAVAAATLLGREVVPEQVPPYFWSDQYGVRLQFAGYRRAGDVVEVVEGDPGSRSVVAVYRRAGRPVAVLSLNQPKLFGRWRRQLAVPEPEVVR